MAPSKRVRRRNLKPRSSNHSHTETRSGRLSHLLISKLAKPSSEYYISQKDIRNVSAGCIVWLPAKERILPHRIVDDRLHQGAFNHPAVILSIPNPLAHSSVVDFAIMTSCGGRTPRQASKLRHRSQLLRVETSAHPGDRVDLKLKNELGMAGEHSYVGLTRYRIQLDTLGYYQRQIGKYCLTSESLEILLNKIEEHAAKRYDTR